MRLFFRSLFIFFLLILLLVISPNTVNAATIPYTITLGVSGRSPDPVGETFLTTNLTVNYQSGSIVLSGKPDGTGNTLVDDAIEMVITVTQPNGSSSTFVHSYETGCYTISESPPQDVTSFFGQGENKVTVRLYDVCGVNLFSSPLYLVNLNAPDPTLSKTPLILIPGIGGSELKTTEMKVWAEDNGHGGTFNYLYPKDELVWLNEPKATEFGEDDYFDVLRMQSDGITSGVNIGLTGNLLARAYQGEIDFFTSNGYELNKDFFVFPYDWRLDISNTASLLDQKIQSVKTQTGAMQVDIVAHSMGGLVARNYISDAGRAQKVRKLIDLGTPHLGSVDAIKNLLYGGCLTKPGILTQLANHNICFGLVPSEVKDVIQNMISAYELVPTQEYFDFYTGTDIDHPYPFPSLNYFQMKTFLTGLNYNTSLFGPAETFHNLDNNLSNTNGVEVTNIAGSGLPTLGQIIEKTTTDLFGKKITKKDIVNINGDQTVPLFSASLYDLFRNKSLLGNTAKAFYTNQEHGSLIEPGPALNLAKNILNGVDQLPVGASVLPYFFSGTQVSSHSPVNLHVYDQFGNHTGPTSNGDFEANIPGSSYDTLDDAKFIFLPNNGVYDIKLEATDQGSFDFKIREFENDINTTAVLYNDVPLALATKGQANLDTSSSEPPTLQIDQDGNGTIDKDVNPTVILTGDEVYDETPPEANIYFDTQLQDLVVVGSDDVSQTNVVQTPISKNKEQIAVTDKSGNTLMLTDTNRVHGSNSVFSITGLSYNSVPAVTDTNKLFISYQKDKNGALKSFSQKFEIKGVVKIQLSYDPKTNKTLVILDRQKITVDGMKILQISTDKGSLKYSY